MIKFLIFLSVLFSNSYISVSREVTSQVAARSYIAIDANTNNVIEGKNINLKRSVASISKIMTAIIAIENKDIQEKMVVPPEVKKAYGSSVYLAQGDILSLEDLLYGLMLRSGNDAAITIAIGVAGTLDNFVNMMNKKAKELKMADTFFSNPSGLDEEDEGNISTSFDMAILMSYAIKNNIFLKIIGTNTYTCDSHGVWQNKNKILRLYKKSIGGKTGFTGKARRTLVTVAQEDETKLIVVTLDCGGDFKAHIDLYERLFKIKKTIKLMNEGKSQLNEFEINCKSDIFVTLNKDLIKQSKILYKINNNELRIELVNGGQIDYIGQCSVIKVNEKSKKYSWWKQLFRLN